MAATYDIPEDGDYQQTLAYREASGATRRKLNRYKKECDISDQHMFLLLMRQELDEVPLEVRQKGDTPELAMLVIGVLLLWNSLMTARSANQGNGADVPLIFLSLGSFLLVLAVYYLHLLNPYKRAVRRVDKLLRGMPEVQSFREWESGQPAGGDKVPAGGRRGGRRRK